ncbi:MAG: SH3 domain-containing protein [Desulfocapsaceae bacterium]|nr:SH3 domain-containing protein [Desulfocapsaceae bacterium]
MEGQLADLQKKNSQLAAEIREVKDITAKLQMELVEKQAEISRLKSVQAGQEQEIVHKMLPIPVSSVRAEAVTYLAEVKTEIDAAREIETSGNEHVFRQADALFDQSKAELIKNNYDAACLLASHAMELIHSLQINVALHKESKSSLYTEFIVPLQLELVKHSSFRTQPSMSGKVIDTLEPGTTVTASGYKGNWVKVRVGEGQAGWIYFNRLSIP